MERRAAIMVNDISLAVVDAPAIHTTEVARALAVAGFEVDLVARGPDPAIDGVRYHGGPPERAGDLRRLVYTNARAARLLLRRRGRASAVYVREDWGLLPTLALARLLGYRIAIEVNDMTWGPGYEPPRPTWRSRAAVAGKLHLGRATFALATWIVPVTQALADLIRTTYGTDERHFAVLPNGVNVDEVVPRDRSEAIAAAGLDPERRYVAFVGLLVARVAWDVFLTAFARVVETRPDATLLIVGDGPHAGRIDARIAELGLDGNVIRTGFVDRPRVAALTGAATVCLVAHRPHLQQRVGASSMKLTEYMAAGRAIVATEAPGLTEMLAESGAGIVVPPEDPEAMARAIGELLDDPARADALGTAGRRAAVERWSWTAIGARIGELLLRDR